MAEAIGFGGAGAAAHAGVPARAAATPALQAYEILYVAFVVAPILAGADKFVYLLTNWSNYLAPQVARILPFRVDVFMMIVGAIEIVAGLIVAIRPKIGATIVGLWLIGIIVNLLMTGTYFDIALRDLGLCLGAFALARLAKEFESRKSPVERPLA